MNYTIYGLRLSGATEIRYIGMTSHTPESRLSCLISEARLYGRRPTEGFGGWLLDNEGQIDAFPILPAKTKADAHIAERAAVKTCLAAGLSLFNLHLVPADKQIRSPRRIAA